MSLFVKSRNIWFLNFISFHILKDEFVSCVIVNYVGNCTRKVHLNWLSAIVKEHVILVVSRLKFSKNKEVLLMACVKSRLSPQHKKQLWDIYLC